jgi:ABC-2 type transport system permease protein
MNARLLRQTLRWNRGRLVPLVLVGFGWGLLIPVIYVAFGEAFKGLVDSGIIPEQFMNFGSGSLFTLPGALTLGLQHPLAIAFVGVFAVGSTVGAIAGEREKGTLEVLLSRPLSRRSLYLTVAVAVVILIALVLAAILAGELVGAAMQGVSDELDMELMPLVFLNGMLLWSAFAGFGLAASVSFDRHAPALGISMAFLLVNYFLEILGSLWSDAKFLQPYSLFHHFQPGNILTGKLEWLDFGLLGAIVLALVAYALVVFPRRDLGAPS